MGKKPGPCIALEQHSGATLMLVQTWCWVRSTWLCMGPNDALSLCDIPGYQKKEREMKCSSFSDYVTTE